MLCGTCSASEMGRGQMMLLVRAAVPIFGAACIAGCASPAPPIDFDAEYVSLVAEGQPTGGANSWPELLAIVSESKSIVDAIDDQERAIDRDAESRGEAPELWCGYADLNPRCGAELTPRDTRVRAEVLAALRSAHIFDRLAALRASQPFESPPSDRLTSPEYKAADSMLGAFRTLGSASLSSMQTAALDGDEAGAVEGLRGGLLVAEAVWRQPDSLCWLLAIAIESSTQDRVLEIIQQSNSVPATLVDAALRGWSDRTIASIDKALPGARLTAIEMRDRAAALWENDKEDELMELPRPSLSREGLIRLVDEAYADAQHLRTLSPQDATAAFNRLEGSSRAWKRSDRYDQGWPVFFEHLVEMENLFGMQTDGVRVTCAIALFSAKHGAPPASLEELVPEFLDSVPSDPYAPDGAFRYRPAKTLDEALLYSVGFDGEDNAGVPSPKGRHASLKPSGVGYDFVIWPPDCRSAPSD